MVWVTCSICADSLRFYSWVERSRCMAAALRHEQAPKAYSGLISVSFTPSPSLLTNWAQIEKLATSGNIFHSAVASGKSANTQPLQFCAACPPKPPPPPARTMYGMASAHPPQSKCGYKVYNAITAPLWAMFSGPLRPASERMTSVLVLLLSTL